MNPCVIFVYGILVLVHFWNGSLVCAHSCGLTQDIQSLFDRNSTQTIHISESQEGINESGFSFQTTSSTRQSMRFYVDYTNLSDPSRYCSTAGQTIDSFTGGTHTCTASDILTPAIRMKINSVLVPQAVDYIQRALKVNRVTTSIVLESDICFDAITVPAALTTTGITGFDYVLFVGANPVASQNVLAYATPCAYIDNTTGRPVVGLVNFNPAAQDGSQPEKSEVRTAIHEIMHALGFTSQYMATRFPAPYSNPLQSVTLRGKATNIIVTPNIVAKAREFFNCNSITGVELEDAGGQGTAGSHWDKRTMLNDIMTGVIVSGELDLAVSPITLAYFEDTGNYDVDYNQASPRYMFDQNFSLGCGFINDRCNLASGGSGSVFCFNTDRGCTRTRSAIGACNLVTYSDDLPTEFQYLSNPRQGGSLGATDYCPFVMGFSNLVCSNENLTPGISGNGFYFGTDSRCFQTTGSDGSTTLGIRTAVATSIFSGGLRCLRGRCVDDVLQIQPGDSTDWFICPTDGGSIPIEGYNGNVICPPAAEMCSFFPRSFTTTSPSAPTSVPTSAPTSLPTSAPTSEPTSSPASAPGSSLPSNSPRDGTSSSVRYLPTISAAVLIIFCFA